MTLPNVHEHAFRQLCAKIYEVHEFRTDISPLLRTMVLPAFFSEFKKNFGRLMEIYPPELHAEVILAGLSVYNGKVSPEMARTKLSFMRQGVILTHSTRRLKSRIRRILRRFW